MNYLFMETVVGEENKKKDKQVYGSFQDRP
jgi:hypothetical protein